MKFHESSITLSATDLCNHLECPHLTSLGLIDLTNSLEKDPPDEEAQLIMQKGIDHETRWLETLREQGRLIIELKSKGLSDSEREEKTIEALRDGADVIYQPFLASTPFIGYADFLYRTTTPSKLGEYSYEVVDAKLGKHPKPYYVIQLCLYSELLAKHLGHTPERMHIALGDNRLETLYVKDFYHYYSHLKNQMLNHIENRPETYPEECGHCERCVFRSRCENQRLEDDHLSQVANILRRQIKKLKGVDVKTLNGLAKLKLTHIKGIGDNTLKRLKIQAQLQHHKKTTGKDKCVVLTGQQPGKGFNLLPKPDPGDLFYDIEGDPLFTGGLEYLHGVFYLDKNKEKFLNLWAHDHQEERSAFEKLIDFFIDRLRRYPEMHIHHYASYEETALKRLMSKYGTREAEVDHLLRSKVFVDLYKVVSQGIQISEPSYSIKNLERFYMDARKAEVKTASGSIVWYEKYIETGEQKFLEDIKQYNLEDCKSLKLLQDWLIKLKKKHFEEAETAEIERESFDQRDDPIEQQLREFERVLLKDLPEKETDYTPEHRLRKNINDLANFYRREAKPAWWRMFSRQTMLTEELIDDGECIGGLTLSNDPKPFVEKQSTVYTFDFPEQEYKLSEGKSAIITDSLLNAGSIYSLDQKSRKIQLKRGNKSGPLPNSLDIAPTGPISTKPLQNALWRFIRAFIENIDKEKRPYPAILDILTCTPPRIAGVPPGQPLYDAENATIESFHELVERMEDTHLFIQGPPGTGKTYTAAHLIVELMKKGYKVGVTANSHKVIHNLLSQVERRAKEIDFEFEGVKKASWSSDETNYKGPYIHSVGSTDEAIGSLSSCKLIAGTAWLFSNMGESVQIDYIFVDEAGQMSLANYVAVATAARNMILVGDQMQLAQPSQGIHPGESGLSVLNYLLRGKHTIPVEEGILLETTYRMHPKICEFISEAIYDGRLSSLDGLQNQVVLSKKDAPIELPEAGLICHFVQHEGSVQQSDEEADHIKKLYDLLLTYKYKDQFKKVHNFTPESILVVSPYNMQVNNLKRVLGDDARVGTVDKFQGQEAEVVIVSMATSSPEEIPRGIDFLYSQNRLNVSLSRAKALSVLVMSPELLSVTCKTPEHMRLVNTLCWVKSHSDTL